MSKGKKKVIYTLGEFFSGPGGLALGAVSSKVFKGNASYAIEHAWATDYDEDSCKTYRRNICPQSPDTVICRNIHEIDFSTLSKVDIFAYGFPCNDFSVVGEQKGFDGSFGPLYSYGVKYLELYKPMAFVAENVGGITSANGGKALKVILSELEKAGNGYVMVPHLYRAEKYGVPQSRLRLVIVGIDKTLKLTFRIPSPTTPNPADYVTARQALEFPPIPMDAENNEITTQGSRVVERLKHIKPWENVWTADLPEHLKLNVKGAKLSQIYRRLHPDKPSYTITGSGGGGTHGYHWDEARALTNRERARLQSFPDKFVFEGSKEKVRKQIGMAVPPLLSQIIFTSLLKTFAGESYPSISAKEYNFDEEKQLELISIDA